MTIDSHFGPIHFNAPFWSGDAGGPADLTETQLAKLAEAARASASYPIGFEPAKLVGETPSEMGDEAFPRPSMEAEINWQGSRWALDGGLVMNAPVDLVLNEVVTQPADGPVRRLLLHVTPDSPSNASGTTDLVPQPEIPEVFGAVHKIQSHQSLAREVRRLENHNSRAEGRGKARTALLTAGITDRIGDEELDTLKGHAVTTLSWRFMNSVMRHRSVACVLGATRDVELQTRSNNARLQIVAVRRDQLADAGDVVATAEVVEQSAALALALIRETQEMPDAAGSPTFEALGRIREGLTDAIVEARSLAKQEIQDWASAVLPILGGEPDALPPASAVELEPYYELLTSVAGALEEAASLDAGAEHPSPLALMLADGREMLRRLFLVSWFATGGFAYSGEMDQKLEMAVLSGRAWNGFAQQDGCDAITFADGLNGSGTLTNATQKLTGMGLMHFAAFLKPSWRANDWMWGRLDGAYHLCRLLLDSKRLWQLERTAEHLISELEELTGQVAPQTVKNEISSVLPEPRMEEFPAAASAPMEATARWLVREVQQRILKDELPMVGSAIEEDWKQGAEPSREAKAFAEQARDEQASEDLLCRALPLYEVHRERVGGDETRDYARAIAVKTAAVAASGTHEMLRGHVWLRRLSGALTWIVSWKARRAQRSIDRVRRRAM